jgi:hypothetical protein
MLKKIYDLFSIINQYNFFLKSNERFFIKNNNSLLKKRKLNNNNFKKNIFIQTPNNYYFLLLLKILINEKNLLDKFNIYGLWPHSFYPNQNKNTVSFKLKEIISSSFSNLLFYKWQSLYKSVGVKKIIKIHDCYDNSDKNRILLKTQNIINKIKKNNDILNIRINNIFCGDLIYDTYIRYRTKPTVDINDNFLSYIIYKFFIHANILKNIQKKYKIWAYFSSYSSYISHGLPIRIFIKKKVHTYSCGSMFSYFKKLNNKRYLHSEDALNFKKIFNSLKNKKNKINLARKEMKNKFLGVAVSSNQYLKINTYNTKNKIKFDKKLNNLYGVVFLHDFFDAPHDQDKLIFSDFFEWTIYTIELIKKNNLRIAIKPHPNSITKSINIENELIKKYPEITWIDRKISNLQIFKLNNFKFGISANGSVLYELPYFNKIGISAGTNPTSAFSFNRNPKSVKEYKKFIFQCHNKKKIYNLKNRDELFSMYYTYCMHDKDDIKTIARKVNLLWEKVSLGESDIKLNIVDSKINNQIINK